MQFGLTSPPQAGHEQAGRVLSPISYNAKTGLAIFCPITNKVKGYPFEVAVPAQLEVSGVVLSDQVKCLDWKARCAERIVHLPQSVTDEVLKKLKLLL
jgi:mRNA interferase MazF